MLESGNNIFNWFFFYFIIAVLFRLSFLVYLLICFIYYTITASVTILQVVNCKWYKFNNFLKCTEIIYITTKNTEIYAYTHIV